MKRLKLWIIFWFHLHPGDKHPPGRGGACPTVHCSRVQGKAPYIRLEKCPLAFRSGVQCEGLFHEWLETLGHQFIDQYIEYRSPPCRCWWGVTGYSSANQPPSCPGSTSRKSVQCWLSGSWFLAYRLSLWLIGSVDLGLFGIMGFLISGLLASWLSGILQHINLTLTVMALCLLTFWLFWFLATSTYQLAQVLGSTGGCGGPS